MGQGLVGGAGVSRWGRGQAERGLPKAGASRGRNRSRGWLGQAWGPRWGREASSRNRKGRRQPRGRGKPGGKATQGAKQPKGRGNPGGEATQGPRQPRGRGSTGARHALCDNEEVVAVEVDGVVQPRRNMAVKHNLNSGIVIQVHRREPR